MQRRIIQSFAVVVLMVLVAARGPASSGTVRQQRSDQVPLTAKVATHAAPYQVGTASWYGDDFDGKETASGEPFNMYDLTAAHLTLPLGTYVRVTNLKNRKAVTVRINDRGPVVPGRIIDLSYSAAQVLHFKDQGIQRVRLDIVRPTAAHSSAAHPKMMASLTPMER